MRPSIAGTPEALGSDGAGSTEGFRSGKKVKSGL